MSRIKDFWPKYMIFGHVSFPDKMHHFLTKMNYFEQIEIAKYNLSRLIFEVQGSAGIEFRLLNPGLNDGTSSCAISNYHFSWFGWFSMYVSMSCWWWRFRFHSSLYTSSWRFFSSLWWRTRVEESLEDFWCFGGGRKFYDYGGEDTKIIKGTTKYY